MPRDGTETYVLPFPDVVADTTIESPVYNGFTNDVAQDLNTPRPIVYGGTGATSAAGARTALSVEAASQLITNYDSFVFEAGSFYSAAGATAAPTANAFSGICYKSDANNIVIEGRDSTTGTKYVRRKVAGVWGVFVVDGSDQFVEVAGDTMTGALFLPTPATGDNSTTAATTAYVLDAIDKNASDNYLTGLTLSTPGSPTLSVAEGEATNSTNAVLIKLIAAISKDTSTPWAVGTGNGSLDTGAVGSNVWYHVFLIRRSDTGVVDVLTSLSISAPTLPASYTQFRRIGSVRVGAGSSLLAFTQVGDMFLWQAPVLDLNAVAVTTTPTLYPLTVPSGLNIAALFRGAYRNSVTAGAYVFYSSPLEVTTPVIGSLYCNNTSFSIAADFQIVTNTASQIYVQSGTAANNQAFVQTYGWIDTRGK